MKRVGFPPPVLRPIEFRRRAHHVERGRGVRKPSNTPALPDVPFQPPCTRAGPGALEECGAERRSLERRLERAREETDRARRAAVELRDRLQLTRAALTRAGLDPDRLPTG